MDRSPIGPGPRNPPCPEGFGRGYNHFLVDQTDFALYTLKVQSVHYKNEEEVKGALDRVLQMRKVVLSQFYFPHSDDEEERKQAAVFAEIKKKKSLIISKLKEYARQLECVEAKENI